MGALSILMGVPASLMSDDDEVILKPVMSEDISESASVSNHAVEDGSDIADHVDPANGKLSISTIITRDMNLIGVSLFGADKSPEEKITLLKKWLGCGTLLTYSGPVFKGIGVLKQGIDIEMRNLVLSGASFKRDVNTGGGFNVALTLEQIRIACAKEVVVDLPKAARSTVKKGPAETAKSGSSQSKTKSIIYQWAHK